MIISLYSCNLLLNPLDFAMKFSIKSYILNYFNENYLNFYYVCLILFKIVQI